MTVLAVVYLVSLVLLIGGMSAGGGHAKGWGWALVLLALLVSGASLAVGTLA